MITAHDKAVELIEKFKPLVTIWDCYNDSPQDEIFVIKDAKQCALIAVNEILNLNIPDFLSYQFWEEVKEEITNLK
jgi:hypothetical protein